jgi:hypothetical protein
MLSAATQSFCLECWVIGEVSSSKVPSAIEVSKDPGKFVATSDLTGAVFREARLQKI